MGYKDKQKVKCSSCGNESSDIHLRKFGGILKWVCGLCNNRIAKRNGE